MMRPGTEVDSFCIDLQIRCLMLHVDVSDCVMFEKVQKLKSNTLSLISEPKQGQHNLKLLYAWCDMESILKAIQMSKHRNLLLRPL